MYRSAAVAAAAAARTVGRALADYVLYLCLGFIFGGAAEIYSRALLRRN